MKIDDDAVQELAHGIVIVAVQDYVKAKKKLMKNPNEHLAQQLLRDVEKFFKSGWFVTLTGFDGNVVLGKLEEQMYIKMKQAKGKRNKKCDDV